MRDHTQYGGMDETAVDVGALFRRENRVKPLFFLLDDTQYEISRILEETHGETLKKRGAGIRYKIQVIYENHAGESFLFRIGDLWYLAGQYDVIPNIQTRHTGMNFSGRKIIDSRYNNPYKVEVDVVAICRRGGKVEPYAFWWEDGTEYQIDRILSQERAVSLKAGIVGMRYTIRVRGRETYLFRDDDLWFMERKGQYRVLDVHGRPLA